jgi:glycine/D-amino acid oxidase-like deaminating enzyme
VNDTIRTRHYSASQASMRQLQPSALIDTAERFHQQTSPQLPTLPTKFYGGGGDVHIIGAGAVGSAVAKALGATGATRVVLVDVDQATSTAVANVKDYIASLWSQWAETTQTALQRQVPAAKPAPSAAARLRVERLAAIQGTLGLSTSDLAQALGLSRPGLYKWLDASSDVKLQGASRERLAVVERIAKQWLERSTAPLRSVAHEPLANGRAVLEMMAADVVDEAAIVGALNELVAKLQAKPKSRSQKLAEAGYKRRPSSRALPADE